MNTFKTPTTAIKAMMISLISVGLFGGAAAMADQAGLGTRSKTVSFNDLDLSTVQGQQIAQERVHQMARTLCDQVSDPTDMSHQTNYVACVDAAVAKAGVGLQALISKHSTAKFARSDAK
jgi:UrcA family protein